MTESADPNQVGVTDQDAARAVPNENNLGWTPAIGPHALRAVAERLGQCRQRATSRRSDPIRVNPYLVAGVARLATQPSEQLVGGAGLLRQPTHVDQQPARSFRHVVRHPSLPPPLLRHGQISEYPVRLRRLSATSRPNPSVADEFARTMDLAVGRLASMIPLHVTTVTRWPRISRAAGLTVSNWSRLAELSGLARRTLSGPR